MPELMRVRTVFAGFSGAPGLMTQYFRGAVAPVSPSLAQLAIDRVKDAFTARHANFPVAWTWATQPQVDVLDDATGEVINSYTPTASNGAGTSSVSGYAPIASGVLVRWLTGAFVGGHRVVGKTYLVPTGNNTMEANGTLSSGALTEYNAWGAAMLNAGASDCLLHIWSRPRKARAAGPGNKPTAQTARTGSSYPVTAAITNDKMCVLTSRRD